MTGITCVARVQSGERREEDACQQRDMMGWQGGNAGTHSLIHTNPLIFNPYWLGRGRTGIGGRKSNRCYQRDAQKQAAIQRAASALLIPVFCFVHNHLFLVSSSEHSALSAGCVRSVTVEAGASHKPHTLTPAQSQELALGDGSLSSEQKAGCHTPPSETVCGPRPQMV